MGRIVDENYEPVYCDALESENEYVGKKLDLVEVVRCHDCENYEEAKNGCNGFCKEWKTSTYSWEWCSRGNREDEVEE